MVRRRILTLAAAAGFAIACTTTKSHVPLASTIASPVPTVIGAFDPSGFSPSAVAAWTDRHLIVAGGVGGDGAVAVSVDAGLTWSIAATSTQPLTAVATLGGQLAWAQEGCAGDGCTSRFIASNDDGLTWSALPTAPDAFRSVAVADALHWWAVSAEGPGIAALSLTEDGGRTWRPQPSPCPAGWNLAEVAAAGLTMVWAGCTGGGATIMEPKAIVATGDGGVSWEVVALNDPSTGARIGRIGTSGHLIGLTALGDHLWAWADRGVLSESRDAGRTWSDLPLGAPDVVTVASASFTSDLDGYAIVSDADAPGILLERTADGGQTWAVVATFAR